MQNLPFGVFRRDGRAGSRARRRRDRRPHPRPRAPRHRAATVLGRCRDGGRGGRSGADAESAAGARHRPANALRRELSDMLAADGSRAARERRAALLVPIGRRRARCCRPRSATTPISSAGIHHATNGGRVFRPEQSAACPISNRCRSPITAAPRRSCVERHAVRAARRASSAPRGAAAPILGPSPHSITSSNSASSSAPGNALGEPIPIGERRASTSSASAS